MLRCKSASLGAERTLESERNKEANHHHHTVGVILFFNLESSKVEPNASWRLYHRVLSAEERKDRPNDGSAIFTRSIGSGRTRLLPVGARSTG